MTGNIGFTVNSRGDVQDVASRLRQNLEGKGYGVLSTIDVQKILREKNDQDIDPYLILEVCNPRHAGNAIGRHRDMGLVLPCKISVYRDGALTKVSLLKPTAAVKMTGFKDMDELAESVEKDLRETVESIRD